MVTFKSFNNIVLDMLQQLRLTQPSLDTKPGTVSRDLQVDLQASQISEIYEALREIATLQSVSNLTGQDLTNYASNYGISRQNGTKSIGSVVFTFKEIDTDITIPTGTLVRTRNGLAFSTVSTLNITTSQTNSLRATAVRLRNQLDTAGITDTYAVEASVEANSSGSIGNISSYSIIITTASDTSNVTNLTSFVNGTDLESDEALRARILAAFAGTNVGTAVGYRSIILNLPTSIDALVIEPGDPLMVRDGTVTVTDSDGITTVSEPGTGGRVDIYVMGENPQSGTDSFVFNDISGKEDPTDSSNNFVMGQSSLTSSTSLTLNSRRVATLSEGADIPTQPVSKTVSVSGSSSGPNFVEQYLDTAGNLQGNYALVKDTGYAGGSPFGLDKFVWTSDRIVLDNESNTKGIFNGIDELSFIDVLTLNSIDQEVQVTNENSTVLSTNRSYVTLKHTPIKTVTRVFNLTTGERYVIADQNPDGTGDTNTTGRIQISGRTLPTASDVLQVDYLWVFAHDSHIDYDNLTPKDPLNESQDSVEWGFSNYIRDELSTAVLDSYGNLSVTTTYPVSRILSVNSYASETVVVGANNSLTTSASVQNIHSITDTTLSGEPEVYNTSLDDGIFSNVSVVLPSDTLAVVGDSTNIIYNLVDISDVDGYDSATAVNNLISINPSTTVSSGTQVLVNYVANFLNILPSTNISALPVSTDGFNSFLSVDGYQPVQNVFSGTTVVSNQRRSPSNLNISISGIPNSGSIKLVGTTINKVTDYVFVSTSSNLDLSVPIRNAEGISNSTAIPSTIYVSRIVSIESVSLSTSNEVSEALTTYDLTNYSIKNSKWDRASALENSSLAATAVTLAATAANTSDPIRTGTTLRVTFYYAKENDYENMYFSRNGAAVTDKRFGDISSINRLSGFQDSSGTTTGKLIINTFNQPVSTASYLVNYDYTSPKENERITINFEYNRLITDAVQAIEDSRPITADVLVKAATKIEIDVTAYIIVSSDFKDKETTVKQDVADNISSKLSSSELGSTLDSSDIINSVYNVAGVDRVRITKFNRTNVSGTKLSIVAEKSEYLAAGIVTVEVEDR